MRTFKRQSGIALAVSLVLLLVVTLIAVAALNVAKRDRQSSTNVRHATNILYSAEQRANQEMNNVTLIAGTTTTQIPASVSHSIRTSGEVKFGNVGPVPQSMQSLLSSKNIGSGTGIQAFYYDVSVNAEHMGVGAAADLNVGFLVPAPKDVSQQ